MNNEPLLISKEINVYDVENDNVCMYKPANNSLFYDFRSRQLIMNCDQYFYRAPVKLLMFLVIYLKTQVHL